MDALQIRDVLDRDHHRRQDRQKNEIRTGMPLDGAARDLHGIGDIQLCLKERVKEEGDDRAERNVFRSDDDDDEEEEQDPDEEKPLGGIEIH